MDDNKKPGQRDISDLKARLGLKKTAPAPAPSPTGTPPAGVPAHSGIPAPTGQPSGPPPPFGQPAPQPAPQAPPDPRRDPFATAQAANLAAFYGIGQQLPGDASDAPNKTISGTRFMGRVVTLLIACGVAFGVGSSCGAIYKQRVEFNHTIDQATQISEEIHTVAKQTEKLRDTLKEASQKGPPAVAEALAALDLKKPDQQKLFRTNYKELEDVAVDRLMSYYNHTILLYDLVRQHASRTDNDKDAIKRGLDAVQARASKRYGVLVKQQGGVQVATFAELGSPTCGAGKTDCQPADISGFQYRTDAAQKWGDRPLKANVYSAIVPIEPSPLFATVAAGNPDVLAARDYEQRTKNISDLLGALAAEEREVKKDMDRAAQRPKVFTF